MRRAPLLLALVALALAALPGAEAAAQSAAGCSASDSKTVVRNRFARVYET